MKEEKIRSLMKASHTFIQIVMNKWKTFCSFILFISLILSVNNLSETHVPSPYLLSCLPLKLKQNAISHKSVKSRSENRTCSTFVTDNFCLHPLTTFNDGGFKLPTRHVRSLWHHSARNIRQSAKNVQRNEKFFNVIKGKCSIIEE